MTERKAGMQGKSSEYSSQKQRSGVAMGWVNPWPEPVCGQSVLIPVLARNLSSIALTGLKPSSRARQ